MDNRILAFRLQNFMGYLDGDEPPHPEALTYLTTKMGLSVFDAKEACANLI